jgi:hypothetical protein
VRSTMRQPSTIYHLPSTMPDITFCMLPSVCIVLDVMVTITMHQFNIILIIMILITIMLSSLPPATHLVQCRTTIVEIENPIPLPHYTECILCHQFPQHPASELGTMYW